MNEDDCDKFIQTIKEENTISLSLNGFVVNPLFTIEQPLPHQVEYDPGGWNRKVYHFKASQMKVDPRKGIVSYSILGPIMPRRMSLWEFAKKRIRQWWGNK